MGCELYLIRHGLAEARGDKWPDDTKRPLTEEGMSRLRKSARGLAAIGVSFDAILTSSLTRARQTAEIVGAELDRPPIFTIESLAPGGAYAAVTTDLEKYARRERLALVGHEPGIGELGARLIGSRHAIPFKKGAVCRIDVASIPLTGPGELRWMLPPKVLLRLRS
jgi:phosphohistidine phosphatase